MPISHHAQLHYEDVLLLQVSWVFLAWSEVKFSVDDVWRVGEEFLVAPCPVHA
jgi:hypothetical protein